MLVLSRKLGQSIEIAGDEIVVRVIGLTGSKVQLGIDAPRDITINRSERSEREPRFSDQPPPQRTALPGISRDVVDELSRIEAEMAALAELASPQDRVVARRVAAESIERIESMKRVVRLASRTQAERPLSEFMKTRADLVTMTPVAEKATAMVRQRPAAYAYQKPSQRCCSVA